MFKNQKSEKDRALAVLPSKIRKFVRNSPGYETLTEIVVDLGRPTVVRYSDDSSIYVPDIQVGYTVTSLDIWRIMRKVSKVYDNNRGGIKETLHRVSVLRDRSNKVIGVTIRVAKHIEDVLTTIQDIVASGKSTLLIGPPGSGKTSKLRSACYLLANKCDKRVMIVDTSNEIAGDLEVPHHAVGMSRRIMVPSKARQAATMIEAIENHTPEVIVIDEISLEAEAKAALTCAERGVQLLATVHGDNLDSLLYNYPVNILLGEVGTVTLSDDEARRRGTSKTVPERKVKAVFDVLIELIGFDEVAVYHELEKCVDARLAGKKVLPEIRRMTKNGEYIITQKWEIKDAVQPTVDTKTTDNRIGKYERTDQAAKIYSERPGYSTPSRKGSQNKRRR